MKIMARFCQTLARMNQHNMALVHAVNAGHSDKDLIPAHLGYECSHVETWQQLLQLGCYMRKLTSQVLIFHKEAQTVVDHC